jgi:hypothetical protein
MQLLAEKVQYGEKLRKPVENCYPYRENKVIVNNELDKRIGCIVCEGNGREGSTGTGFRVGSKYVMTAFHVMKETLSKWLK